MSKLKRELKIKGGWLIFAEAASLVALFVAGYVAIVMLEAYMYVELAL